MGLAHRPLLSFILCYFPFGRWPIMLEFWSGVFPLEIPPSNSMHQGLHCLFLVCELVPHLATPRYHAILATLLRPLVEFQNISKKCCL